MNATDEQRALLAAIRANPEEDTPRLAYADWLQENAGTEAVRCPECSPYANDPCPQCCGSGITCSGCRGSKTFPPGYRPERDPGSGRHEGAWTNCKTCNNVGGTPGTVTRRDSREARAELIRAQIRLVRELPHVADDPDYPVKAARWSRAGEYKSLVTRQAAILAQHADEWRRGPKCGKCKGKGVLRVPDWHPPGEAYCDSCWGAGDAGGLMRLWTIEERHDAGLLKGEDRYFARINYSRGMKVVRVPRLSDCVREVCRQCGGYDRLHASMDCDRNEFVPKPTPWLAAVCEHHPDVVSVVPMDRAPTHSTWSHKRTAWGWANLLYDGSNLFLGSGLPIGLHRMLPHLGIDGDGTHWKWFNTKEDAEAALGSLLVRIGHGGVK